ncbi:MFS transporter [Paraglaciecola mesophila]|uniref:MFS transporter n=1 Tax=Paraglaciecola mesophila TaxID=197222 RepID=A0ABU9SQY2_9ALTE
MRVKLGLILYFGLASMVANAALVFAPLLISGLAITYQFSEANAVFVISTELFASAFAALPALWWVSKFSWRKVSNVSLLAVVITNLLSALMVDLEWLVLLRAISGFFAGSLLILYMVVIAALPDTERIFSGKLVLQLIFSALGMGLLPYMIAHFGVDVVYLLLAALGLLLLVLKTPIPANHYLSLPNQSQSWSKTLAVQLPANNLLILIALFVFAVGTNIVWSALVPLGMSEGVSLADIGWVLSIATILAVFGGFMCTVIGARFGRAVPIGMGLVVGSAGAILLMFSYAHGAYFLIGTSLICIARVVTIPYLVGLMSVFNQFGRLAILSHVALASGMALGSFVVSVTIAQIPLHWLPVIALICMVVTALVVLPLIYQGGLSQERRRRALSVNE